MQRILFIIAAVLSLGRIAMAEQPSEDLIIQTRLEQKTLSWLIDKTRTILSNVQIDDKLADEVVIDTDPTFTMDDMSTDADFVRFRDLIANVFKVDLKNAVIRLRIPKIYYKIDTIHATPLALNVHDPVLDLHLQAQLKGLYVKLGSGVQADFMIPNPKTKVLESYLTATVEPISVNIPKTMEPITFDLNFETLREQEFKFTLKSFNLERIPQYIDRNQKQLIILGGNDQKGPLTADHIKVNPITVRLNHLTRSLALDAFKPVLQKKMPQILSSVLSLVGGSLKNSIGPKILKGVFASNMRSTLLIENPSLFTRFAVTSFSQPDSNQLSLGVTGDLCTAEAYNRLREQCATQAGFKNDPIRSILTTDKQKALDELRGTLARGDADIAMSVSEEYLNRLLTTTVNAKLWDDMLKKDHLGIGPKGAFIVFNQRTKNPELFLDLLYYGDKGIQKLFVNERKPIRFALRMSTSLAFTIKDEVPFLLIKTEKLLSDTNEVINGIPEYDLTPKLVPLLRKKIAKMVIEMAGKLQGSTVVEMDVPVFKGLGLETTTYEVSPYGRLNLFFKL